MKKLQVTFVVNGVQETVLESEEALLGEAVSSALTQHRSRATDLQWFVRNSAGVSYPLDQPLYRYHLTQPVHEVLYLMPNIGVGG